MSTWMLAAVTIRRRNTCSNTKLSLDLREVPAVRAESQDGQTIILACPRWSSWVKTNIVTASAQSCVSDRGVLQAGGHHSAVEVLEPWVDLNWRFIFGTPGILPPLDRHTEAPEPQARGFLMFCNMVLPGVVPLGGGSYCTEKVLPLMKQQLGAV
jgi:hypothetical protein